MKIAKLTKCKTTNCKNLSWGGICLNCHWEF